MRNFLKPLPPGAEFLIVVTVAFGVFIVRSLYGAVHPGPVLHHTDRSVLVVMGYELAVLIVMGTFLHLRGWTLGRIGLAPTLKDTAIGAGLALAAYAAYAAAWIGLVTFAPDVARSAAQTRVYVPGMSPLIAAALVIVNPVFEEVFAAGYTISALKDSRGESFAFNASVAIRLLYHLYQGALAVISVVPQGLIFAFWYVKTGRLWPLIVAHALLATASVIQAVKF